MHTTLDPQDSEQMSISYRGLLLIYLAVPLCLLACLADYFFFNKHLLLTLPRDPDDLRIITVFFHLPHIVASALTFLDKDYVSAYRNRLLLGIPFILSLVLLLPYLVGPIGAYVVFVTYTVFHVITQQIGVTTLMVGPPTRTFFYWKWIGLLCATLIFLAIYGGFDIWSPQLGDYQAIDVMHAAIALLFLPYLFLSKSIASKSQTSIGRWYVWANSAMIIASLLLAASGYFFFAIIGPRIIHDLTAFVFYTVHDHNRNLKRKNNVLLKALSKLGAPIALLSPAIAIAIANLLFELKEEPWMNAPLLSLIYFHYYSEAVIWKRDSAHRASISVRKPQWEQV